MSEAAIASIMGSGPQMKAASTEPTSIQFSNRGLALLAVYPTGQEINLLCLAFEDVQHGQAPEILFFRSSSSSRNMIEEICRLA